MINEHIMAQGSFDVRLLIAAKPSLWDTVEEFGHIVLLPQQIDPNLLGDASMLAASRFTGVVLEKRVEDSVFTISGAGLAWWMGDEDGKGDIIETKVELTNANLDACLTAILPDAITKGTVTEPGITYTGTHQWETPLEALRTIAASLGVEWRINMDGTLDAGPANSLFTGVTTPQVVVTDVGLGGSDPNYLGIESSSLAAHLNSRQYASRAIVITEDSENVLALVGGQNRSPAPTATDLHGNTLTRTLQLETFGSPVSVATYLTSQMNENTTILNMDVATGFSEIINGQFYVGDGFYCYSPPGFVDTDNRIQFRGDTIFPKCLRLIAASWPVREGMGVYYRSPDVTATWTDLTRFVEWEEGGYMGTRI